MTPERKKKLRQVLTTIHQYLLYLHLHPYRHHHLHPNPHQLLMREAAKQLKIEQEKKEAERRKVMIPISIPSKRNQTGLGHQPFQFFALKPPKRSNPIQSLMIALRWLEREPEQGRTLRGRLTNSWRRSATSITSDTLVDCSSCLNSFVFVVFSFKTNIEGKQSREICYTALLSPSSVQRIVIQTWNNFRRIVSLESEKFDLERDVQVGRSEIILLTIHQKLLFQLN